jgi:alanine dehydrogenase
MPFVVHLATVGVHQAVAGNPGLKLGVNVAAGEVTYKPVAAAVGVPHVAVDTALAGVPA